MPSVPAANAQLHSKAGRTLGVEATAFTAAQSLTFTNNGDYCLHINATTPGTGVVAGLVSANNQAITIASGNNLYGPFDQAIYGQSVTLTTASAVGTAALYHMPPRTANGLHNPYQTNPDAVDG